MSVVPIAASERQSPKISIVAPMHDEEACLDEFIGRVTKVLAKRGDGFEILAISDGSTDATNDMLKAIAAIDPRVRPLFLSRNIGQWAAIAAGLRASRGAQVVVMDADLQHLPEEIPLLLDVLDQGVDFVSGCRQNRTEGLFMRRLPSRVANWLLRATTHCQMHDMGGFKAMEGGIARRLNLRAGQHRLLPALVHLMGGSLREVPISAPPRFAGKSHYGLSRSIDVVFDILMLWLESTCKMRPLYTLGRIGLALGLVSVMGLGWIFADKLMFGEHLIERPALYVLLATGMLSVGFVFLGFVLEFLSSISDRQTGRTAYIVHEYDPETGRMVA